MTATSLASRAPGGDLGNVAAATAAIMPMIISAGAIRDAEQSLLVFMPPGYAD